MVKYRTHCRQLCKNGEPIEMSFWMWAWVGPTKHALYGCVLAAPGEYDEPSMYCRDAAFSLNYFDHLLLVVLISWRWFQCWKDGSLRSGDQGVCSRSSVGITASRH